MTDGFPPAQGLYDPRNEHDACGVGFVVDIHGRKSHSIVRQGLEILVNLTHRGAVGADPTMGDGAGIMIQMPHKFLSAIASDMRITLPAEGDYGVAVCFLPPDPDARAKCEQVLEKFVKAEGQTVLGWRDNPVSSAMLSDTVRATEPAMRHLFVARGKNCPDQDGFEIGRAHV